MVRFFSSAKTWTLFGILGVVVIATLFQEKTGTIKTESPKTNLMASRVPWTTSRIKGTPDPPLPYRTEIAFPKLKFNGPLALASTSGTNRLFVVEQKGKIFSFANDPKTEKVDLFLDLGKTIYGLAFHPEFQKNGYVYVTYISPEMDEENSAETRVSRFQVDLDDPLRCDSNSETIVLRWPAGGHNGGCLKFGPDGYLYISTGDGSGIADELNTGQDVSDLLASILRIDVDHPDEGKEYGIPKDNPFIQVKDARPEVWAYGLRQVWKMSFDRQTGDLWAGEVGQDLWEMVYQVRRGENYGWSVNEGSHPFRPNRQRGPTSIVPPISEHPHSEFRSLTGGFVYRGSRLMELDGTYIYGDYDTGRIWGLRYDGEHVRSRRELANTSIRIAAFGEDPTGELYLVDHMTGQIHRLVPSLKKDSTSDFPRKLSQTGLFASVKHQKPAAGVISYSVNAPLWSDGAKKERFLALPGNSKIEFEVIEYPSTEHRELHGWRFPDGTVLVKTFSLEMETGNPASRRKIETRILHFQQFDGNDVQSDGTYGNWHGYTYAWNDDQTDATLVDGSGIDRKYTIADLESPEGSRVQTWHFPSRAECTLCHTMAAKYVLGVNTLQMNKDHDYGGFVANQLRVLDQLGIFTQPLPTPPGKLPRLADPRNEDASLETRARSYLHTNCSHCHRKWGGGNADFQLLFPLALDQTGVVETQPAHGKFGILNAQLFASGDPERSMIYCRMKKLGLGRMPHVGSNQVDENGVQLIHDWIKNHSP